MEGNFLTSSENENFQPTSLSTPPTTSFSCVGRTPGAYYADPEAGCQLFHRCVLFFIFLKFLIFLIFVYFSKYFDSILSLIFRCVVVAGRFFQFPFLCPNGTVFSEVFETKRTKQCYCQALYFNNPPKLMPDQTKRALLKPCAHTGQCTPTHFH